MLYLKNLKKQINQLNLKDLKKLKNLLITKHSQGKNIFICGNGGSAANAEHITNDLMFGFSKNKNFGFRFMSLCSNTAKMTCIANDIGYEKIFSHQLQILGKKDDLIIILTGSGNSKNIINVVKTAKKLNIESFGLLGYSGGKVKKIIDNYIHFKVNDMQISEDMQIIVMNYVMKKLISEKYKFN